MEKSERKKSINIHSDEKGKVIDKEKISLGEISLNTNPEEPFIAFRASGATEDVMVTTVMSARFTTDALGEPTVKNDVLTIPIPKGAQGPQGEKMANFKGFKQETLTNYNALTKEDKLNYLWFVRDVDKSGETEIVKS
ncbi:MAG: hypothetical protein UHU19_02600, partial [Lachnospiraceae bacterium]|nr:hypothetical protein [Lachnospiraceae bacterium]